MKTKNYLSILILANLLFLLGFIAKSIIEKETLLSEGKLVLLELAPVDPRSLMQGDYMTLRYKISENVPFDSIAKRGYCVVGLESSGVASKIRLQEDKTPLLEKEYLIKYTVSGWFLKIGAESFFFQEGQSEKFDKAKYGGIRIDDAGNSLLIGLYDENLKKIE